MKNLITVDGKLVMEGDFMFKLKDTHGLPLCLIMERCAETGCEVDWVGLIESARKAGWWDYQTMEIIEEGFQDFQGWSDRKAAIMERIKAYLMAHPHPKMKETEA